MQAHAHVLSIQTYTHDETTNTHIHPSSMVTQPQLCSYISCALHTHIYTHIHMPKPHEYKHTHIHMTKPHKHKHTHTQTHD